MKRKRVKSNESLQETKLSNNKVKVTTLDSFSVENKPDKGEHVTKIRHVGKSSAGGKPKRKNAKGIVKKNSGSGTKTVGLDTSFSKVDQANGEPKDNSQILGLKTIQGISQSPVTLKFVSTTKASKNLKKKSRPTHKTPTKIHEKLSKPETEENKTNNIHSDLQVQNANKPRASLDNSNKTSNKSSKLKVQSKKGKQNGLAMKKSGAKTKINKLKTFLPNTKTSHKAVGTNLEKLAKPDWVAIKKQTKELRVARKQKRSSYNITVEAKQLWEVLRNQNNPSPSESVQNGVIKMHNLLKSHLAMLVMCHDMSRVVQWLIKMATPEIRMAIIEELKPCIKKMIVDRYASKCIGSLLKYGTKEAASAIIACCMGHVVKLMSNVIAHPYLEKAYAEYATDKQKSEFHLEFYSDLYKSSKDSAVKCLADTYKDTLAMKNAFLTSTKEHIKRVLNKNNATNRSTLLYAVMADFFKECSTADRDEILTIVRGWIFDLPATKDAGYVGMLCVWHATNKEKKTIVKGLKGHIVGFAKSQHLQLILFAVFSLVDDTVLLGKVLIPEVVANIKELGSHVVGRKLIVHLVSYGNTMFFHPSEMKILHKGETTGTSKKDVVKKREELLHLISKPFLESVAEEPEFWFKTTDTCLTALAILMGAEDGDEKQKAFEVLATFLVNPTATSEEDISTPGKDKQKKNKKNVTEAVETKPVPFISHSAVHLTINHLIKENNSFPDVLMQKLTDEAMEYWIPHNRGCFTLVHLLETGKEAVVARVTELLKKHKLLLTSKPSVGAKILLQKL